MSALPDDAKDCGLFLDEMSIDEAKELCPNNKKWYGCPTLPPSEALATKGLVFMLGGVSHRWKQTVAFEFTGNSIPEGCLKPIVMDIIVKAEERGLRVHFVTSDCGSANKTMWKEFGVHAVKTTLRDNLSIEHPCDPDRRLEFIADPVHVFKNSVHGWISNKIIILPDWYVQKRRLTSNIVDRDHLRALVEDDEARDESSKLVCRLSQADVDFQNKPLSNVDKMKVSNATKYCNYSVAAALCVVAEKTNRMCLKTTAAYITDLARWYEIMNSRDDSEALKPAENNYQASIDHINFFAKLMSDIKVGEKGHWKPWQTAAVMSSNAILRLQNYFFESLEYTVLYTSRFVQDCLENLFSVIRYKQKRPTALQMKQHLRSITLSQFMHVPNNSSYDIDEREYLLSLEDLIRKRPRPVEADGPTLPKRVRVDSMSEAQGNLHLL